MDGNRYPLLAQLVGALLALIVFGLAAVAEAIPLHKEFFGLALLFAPIAGFTVVSLLQRWARAAEYRLIPRPRALRHFRFGLRTLFVLVTMASVWCAYQLNWIRQRHAAITSGDVDVFPNCALDDLFGVVTPSHSAPWNLRLFGEQGARIIAVRQPRDLERMQRLFPESSIHTPLDESYDAPDFGGGFLGLSGRHSQKNGPATRSRQPKNERSHYSAGLCMLARST